jgi:hypothetical protein
MTDKNYQYNIVIGSVPGKILGEIEIHSSENLDQKIIDMVDIKDLAKIDCLSIEKRRK